MNPGGPHGRARQRGAMMVVVLVMMAAGSVLSAAIASSAALELAMADRSATRLRAFEAAEAGLAAMLRARSWSAAEPWSGSGTLAGSGEWEAEVRLAAARVDPVSGVVEWRFEIASTGRHGAAEVSLLQAFDVLGALPGEPRRAGWRRIEAAP
jgi:hypothetical protein